MHIIKLKSVVLVFFALILGACSSTPKVDIVNDSSTPKIENVSDNTPPKFEDIVDSAPKTVPVDISQIPDAVPIPEPRTRAGNPVTYTVLGKRYTLLKDSKGYVKKGLASWYGTKFHGRKTANGETYNMYAMTAAHKTLPIPSYVQVTNLQNKRSVVVRINDRGPFHGKRLIDLSYTAASKLDIIKRGTGFVEVRAIEPGKNVAQLDDNSPANKALYLQVGAFSEQANALALQNQIQAYNIADNRILSTNNLGSLVHKVQLGPVESVHEADKLVKTLADLGFNNSRLVVDY